MPRSKKRKHLANNINKTHRVIGITGELYLAEATIQAGLERHFEIKMQFLNECLVYVFKSCPILTDMYDKEIEPAEALKRAKTTCIEMILFEQYNPGVFVSKRAKAVKALFDAEKDLEFEQIDNPFETPEWKEWFSKVVREKDESSKDFIARLLDTTDQGQFIMKIFEVQTLSESLFEEYSNKNNILLEMEYRQIKGREYHKIILS